MFHPKIGLALGGGGPKGLAHIGVIKTLIEHAVPIDYIAGTSAGALVGSMYAYSQDIASVERHIMDKNRLQMISYFADPSLQGGFIEGHRIEQFINEYLQDVSFENLRIPFAAIATDLKTDKKIVITTGSVAKAVRASSAIPILFKPVELDDRLLVDGGLTSPVPVQTAFAMGADIVIAVQLDYRYNPTYDLHLLNPLQVGELALDMVGKKIAEEEMKKASIVLRPHLEAIHWGSLINQTEKEQAVQEGVLEVRRHLTTIIYQTKRSSLVFGLKHFLHRFLQTR
jgi:NTE family protein